MGDVTFHKYVSFRLKTKFFIQGHSWKLGMKIERGIFLAGMGGNVLQHRFYQGLSYASSSSRLKNGKAFQLDTFFSTAPTGGAGRRIVHCSEKMSRFLFKFIIFLLRSYFLFNNKHCFPDLENSF